MEAGKKNTRVVMIEENTRREDIFERDEQVTVD